MNANEYVSVGLNLMHMCFVHVYNGTQNALLSALPHLVMWFFGICLSQFSDYVNRKKWISVTNIRKIANTICEYQAGYLRIA